MYVLYYKSECGRHHTQHHAQQPRRSSMQHDSQLNLHAHAEFVPQRKQQCTHIRYLVAKVNRLLKATAKRHFNCVWRLILFLSLGQSVFFAVFDFSAAKNGIESGRDSMNHRAGEWRA